MEGVSMRKIFWAIKQERPAVAVLGTHHYVQMAGTNLEEVGVTKHDLESVIFFCPVGASVPEICGRKLKYLFPNMKVEFE